jgi:hypothetical protein
VLSVIEKLRARFDVVRYGSNERWLRLATNDDPAQLVRWSTLKEDGKFESFLACTQNKLGDGALA